MSLGSHNAGQKLPKALVRKSSQDRSSSCIRGLPVNQAVQDQQRMKLTSKKALIYWRQQLGTGV